MRRLISILFNTIVFLVGWGWHFLDVISRGEVALKMPSYVDHIQHLVITHEEIGWQIAPWTLMVVSTAFLVWLAWPDFRARHFAKTKAKQPEIEVPAEFRTLCGQVESIVKHVAADRLGHIEVVAIVDVWPTLVRKKEPLPSWADFKYVPEPTGSDVDDERALVRAKFKPPKKFDPNKDETIGLECGVSADGHSIAYYPIKYKTKLALIEQGRPHATISAGAVTVDESGKNLLLHVRSKHTKIVHEAVGRVHCFLGSVRVPSSDSTYDPDASLEAGAMRECMEESGSPVDLRGRKIAIVKWSESQPDGDRLVPHSGLDVVCLGARAINSSALKTAEAYAEHSDSNRWEGHVKALTSEDDAIFKQFTTLSQNWFAPGLAYWLLWLALGAPGASQEIVDSSRSLYGRILDYYAKRGWLIAS